MEQTCEIKYLDLNINTHNKLDALNDKKIPAAPTHTHKQTLKWRLCPNNVQVFGPVSGSYLRNHTNLL